MSYNQNGSSLVARGRAVCIRSLEERLPNFIDHKDDQRGHKQRSATPSKKTHARKMPITSVPTHRTQYRVAEFQPYRVCEASRSDVLFDSKPSIALRRWRPSERIELRPTTYEVAARPLSYPATRVISPGNGYDRFKPLQLPGHPRGSCGR